MRPFHVVLAASILASIGGCASRNISPRAADSMPVIAATFTTMGDMIVAPGRTTSCPAWFWEQWSLSIVANGRVHVEITDGKRVVFSRTDVLTRREIDDLVAFLRSEMTKGPAETGALATDSDYGEITLFTEGRELRLTAQGAREGHPEFAHFYSIIRHLESRLHIPNPYCQ